MKNMTSTEVSLLPGFGKSFACWVSAEQLRVSGIKFNDKTFRLSAIDTIANLERSRCSVQYALTSARCVSFMDRCWLHLFAGLRTIGHRAGD